MKKHIAVLLLILGGLVWLAFSPAEAPGPEALQEPPTEDGRITYNGKAWYPRPRLETVLLLGIDAPPGQPDGSPQQADFLALLIVDSDAGEYHLLHLNRDTLCDVPVLDHRGIRTGYQKQQLALAHSYGTGGRDSCINTLRAVSRLLYDIPLEDYARIPIQALGRLNDAIGGVTVTVADDFSRIDPSLVRGETVTLHGSQAETFVRARGGMEDPTNLARMKRQQQYLAGLLEKMGDADVPIEQAVEVLAEDLETTMSVSRMSRLAESLKGLSFAGMDVLPGQALEGDHFLEYRLDEEALRMLVLERFYTQQKGGAIHGS